MSNKEPITIIEIDMDHCSRVYGVAPCTAALGTSGVRKCFNTYETCQDRTNIDEQPLTLKLAEGGTSLPKRETIFPIIKPGGISAFSTSVNIAGTDPELSAIGKRATIKVDCFDIPYHDRLVDKYQTERIDGTAQNDEGGYQPEGRGMLFRKTKARWPHFSGREIRKVTGYVENGALVNTKTITYNLTDFTDFDDHGNFSFEGKDILALAADDKALAPAPSGGTLAADISDVATTITLEPAGIGDSEYPASGRAVVGSEVFDYTRSSDTITLTNRGARKTAASSHTAGDTFQQVLVFDRARPDDAIETLLSYTTIPASWIPIITKWEPETTRWGVDISLTTDITKPTGVAKLINGLSVLGLSLWPDLVNKEIGLKFNRPVDGDVIHTLNEPKLKSVKIEEQDEKRLTEVVIYSVQKDPTKSDTDKTNYAEVQHIIDPASEAQHGSSNIREIYCRWFNDGNKSATRLIALRLLQEFNKAPARYRIRVDADDGDVGLTDVVDLTTDTVNSTTGKALERRLQISRRYEPISGHEIELICQAYGFEGGRYGYIMPDSTTNDYDTATDDEKATGAFIAENTEPYFSDGSDAYRII